MTNTERLIAALFYANLHRRNSEGQPWRPGEIVTAVPPTAAFIANRAIGEMMR